MRTGLAIALDQVGAYGQCCHSVKRSAGEMASRGRFWLSPQLQRCLTLQPFICMAEQSVSCAVRVPRRLWDPSFKRLHSQGGVAWQCPSCAAAVRDCRQCETQSTA